MDKKILVVYYSLEGNTKLIGEEIAGLLKAEVLELKLKKDFNKKGAWKYFWGGKQVMTGEKPELQEFDKNPKDYKVIIIGTPVWMATYTPALKTFFDKVELKNKKIGLFCCYGTSPGQTFEKMRGRLNENEIIGEISFCEPRRIGNENYKKELKIWIEKFK